MAPKQGTAPWRPVAMPWEGAELSEDGLRIRLVYITGDGIAVDAANVRREDARLTVTLSRMERADVGHPLAARYHCVEVELAAPVGDLILIDGATGERASAKASRYLDPQSLENMELNLDGLFEPSEYLAAREFSG